MPETLYNQPNAAKPTETTRVDATHGSEFSASQSAFIASTQVKKLKNDTTLGSVGTFAGIVVKNGETLGAIPRIQQRHEVL